MITLAIETSTVRGSVAVVENGRLLFSEQFAADRALGTHLFPCLQRARKAAPHYDQIAIGLGPGSYSGVRISIAAATGLELAGGAELLGIPSLLAIETDSEKYIAIGDARRSSFYFALIDRGECVAGPMLLDEQQLRSALASHADVPVFTAEPIEIFTNAQTGTPSAERLARLAVSGRGIIARGQLEPIYLRDPHITQAKKIQ
ncbi:MAG TPA: tRNA (adenosine(37)-N6)-threonylcarbamoyltransferase complex dimerization subunit type 1 TsaB [Chthoniobacteraceae bacterium]|nr:tRNA (adenosine(37)-N6)-threonylcarbamoyltransferase complex dimerization subunit type 1 TsaB [Chthoniobacteraceae bacterium]